MAEQAGYRGDAESLRTRIARRKQHVAIGVSKEEWGRKLSYRRILVMA